MIEVGEEVGPAYWASALVNGDESGMDEREIPIMEAWVERLARDGWRVVSTKDDEEPWFTWNYRLHSGDYAGPAGGDVITYIVHRLS